MVKIKTQPGLMLDIFLYEHKITKIIKNINKHLICVWLFVWVNKLKLLFITQIYFQLMQ